RAEDGIRDRNVTGVQTCALPILLIFGGTFVWTTWRNRFHISVPLSISHSFVHTNASSTYTSCCLSSSFNNFSCAFSCYRSTSTSYLCTSISSHHCLPS